jgi:hypothetical protein
VDDDSHGAVVVVVVVVVVMSWRRGSRRKSRIAQLIFMVGALVSTVKRGSSNKATNKM